MSTLRGKAFDIRTQKLTSVRIVATDFQSAAESAVQWFNDLSPADQTARGELRGLNWVQDGVIVALPIEPFSVTVNMVDQNGYTINPVTINQYGLSVSPQIDSYAGGHPIPVIVSACTNQSGVTGSISATLFKVLPDGTETALPFPTIDTGEWQTIIENVSENTVFKVMFDLSMIAQTIPVTGITVSNPNVNIPAVSQTANVGASVQPSNASNQAVTYMSTNPAVATVNASGVVTGVSQGECVVIAASVDGGYTAFSLVNVVQLPYVAVTGITIANQDITIPTISQTADLGVSVQPANATNQAVVYIVNGNSVNIDSAGVVTGTHEGISDISVVSVDNGSIYSGARVSVAPPVDVTGIAVPPTVSASVGQTVGVEVPYKALVSVIPSNATFTRCTFYSSDNNICNMDMDGIANGPSNTAGTCVLVAVTNDGGYIGMTQLTVS